MGTRTIEGELVFVPDNITPEGLERIGAQIRMEKRAKRRAQPANTPVDTHVRSRPRTEDEEVARRVNNSRDQGGIGWGERAFDALTFGNRARIAGGVNALTQGIGRAVSEGDPSQIGREYRIGRDVEAQRITDYNNDNPGLSVAADVGGALINPVGTGSSAVMAAGRGLGRVGARNAGARAMRVARRMQRAGPVAQGAMAGALQGSLTGASHSDNLSELPENALYGGAIGAGAGTLFGGGLYGARKIGQIVRDARPASAERTAYQRIAEDLENAGLTGRQVRQNIVEGDRQGNDLRVMDMSPNLTGRASDVSRRTNVSRSNELIQTARDRLTDRPSRFAGNVERRAGLGTVDADDTMASIRAARQARGEQDYADGGAMDIPIQATPGAIRTTRELIDNPATSRAVELGHRDAVADGVELGTYDPNSFTHIPSMRLFDAIKRRMDDVIGSALKAGNRTEARRVSQSMRMLKEEIAQQNPQYADILRAQRDGFEQEEAVELGRTIMQQLGRKPRQMLKMINGLNDNQRMSARIGLIDQLINLETKGDPVQAILSMMRLPQQRKILEFAFGSSRKVNSFKQWLEREAMAKEADRQIAPGRTSDTQRFKMAADEGDGGLADLGVGAVKGVGFGGILGGAGNVLSRLDNLMHGTSKYVHNEIARILMSKGEDLEDGIRATAKYVANRKRANRAMSKYMGKSMQQPFTNALVGDDNAV